MHVEMRTRLIIMITYQLHTFNKRISLILSTNRKNSQKEHVLSTKHEHLFNKLLLKTISNNHLIITCNTISIINSAEKIDTVATLKALYVICYKVNVIHLISFDSIIN